MKMNKKRRQSNVQKSKRKQLLAVAVDLEKALGAAERERYLEENPHGYSKINHIHKSKKEYTRKKKHKHCYE
ncbi:MULTISPECIES: hypothetical protein [unclassified Aureispira]|uniref:hypothetical protein n=1 Tax=unclassified Aureispira TaxID=2649989 RepID=UPI000697FD1D|nr:MULTISPECIES: hypothetical protein [unclassified Aureispira]WMX16273.1 hypothetical protein QP953_07830 [Aureispira sp. CCB-E]